MTRTRTRLGSWLRRAGVLCLPVLLAAAVPDAAPVPRVLAVKARRGDFRQTVRVPGELRPEDKARLTCTLDDVSVVSAVPEGTLVSEGDLIVELDGTDIEESILTVKEEIVAAEAALSEAEIAAERANADIEGELVELEAALEVAQARFDLEDSRPLPGPLAIAEARLARAEATLQYADDRLDSTREVFDEGAVSQKEVRAAELAGHAAMLDRDHARKVLEETTAGAPEEDLESARARLTEARVSHEQAVQSREARVVQAESGVKAARSALDALRSKLAQAEEDLTSARITAPRDGIVFAPPGGKLEIGRSVWKGHIVAELADKAALIFRARVREADSRLVAVDQPASVRLLARPGVALAGTVAKTAESLAVDDDEPDVQYLEVEIRLDGVPADVRPRMTGHATVEVVAMPDSVIVPRACVRGGEVVVWSDGGWMARSVDVLATDGSFAAIRGDLAEGEWVLLQPEE